MGLGVSEAAPPDKTTSGLRADRLLAPGEDLGEAPVGERAEERVAGQPGARRRGAGDAREEAGLLSRRPERLRDGRRAARRPRRRSRPSRSAASARPREASARCPVRQYVQCPQGSVRVSPKYPTSAATWQPSCVTSASTLSIRAVSACSRRAKRSTRRSSNSVSAVRAQEERVALAELGRLQLDEPLLVEVVERRHDPSPLLAELGRRVVGGERRPDAPGLAGRDEAAEERRPGVVEAPEDVLEGALLRAAAAGSRRRRASPAGARRRAPGT